MDGGEGGITRACGPRPFGAAVATLRRCLASLRDARLEPKGPHQSSAPLIKQKAPRYGAFCFIGGEGGIRTLDTGLPYTHFPGVLLQPLGHLSGFLQLPCLAGGRKRARLNQNPRGFKCINAPLTPAHSMRFSTSASGSLSIMRCLIAPAACRQTSARIVNARISCTSSRISCRSWFLAISAGRSNRPK